MGDTLASDLKSIAHLLVVQPSFPTPQSLSATLSSTSSTTPMSFPSSSPSPSPRRVEQSRTSPWHHRASNTQLEPRLSHLPLHLFETPPPSPPRSSSLPFLPSFQYLPANKVPNRETTTQQAVPRLLDRLARHALQPARKEGYIKITTIFGHIADARTLWMVDLLGSISTSTNWIGLSRPFSHHPLNDVQHANSFVP